MRRWRFVTSVFAVMIAFPLLLGADGDGPVAEWTFNGEFRRMSRDVAANRHHAVAQDDYAQIDAPGLQAIAFDGVDDFLRVPNDPALVMTDSLTVDLWLMIHSAEGGPQCVVDKGGERYRIQVTSGRPMLGLKSGAERLDLNGGELTPGRWHRVTGVFDRPEARLYVDGEQVARATWDHAIDAGGDLFIGSKGGVDYFFAGAIDELRIYDYPRPPQPDDTPSTEPVGGIMTDAKLEVQELADGARVDTGAAVFELTDDAGLRALTIGGQAVIEGNEQPLMAASVLEAAEYDGWRDYAPGGIVEATWRTDQHRYDANDEKFSAAYTGTLDFGDGDTIDCQILLETRRGSPFLTAYVSLNEPEGDFDGRFIRDLSLRLPLALNMRKRVVQGGDRGIQWNTRHFYQFHVNMTQMLLSEPDHNIWRRFAIDQNSATDYHLWKALRAPPRPR
jgi:hypothetical protein